jgi:hypothetical protein
MSETDADVDFDALLDEFEFEPNGWDFAVEIGIGADESDRAALGDLPDAMRVWADEDELERLTDDVMPSIWNAELASRVREGIMRLGAKDAWRAGAERALEEFDRDPPRSEVAREVVRHLAMQLSFDDCSSFFCLDCLDIAVSAAEPADRRALAVRAAAVASTSAVIPAAELAVARGAVHRSPVLRLGTRDRRIAVRTRLRRLGELGRASIPHLAAELRAIGAEPVPASAADDDVWEVACTHLLNAEVRPELN